MGKRGFGIDWLGRWRSRSRGRICVFGVGDKIDGVIRKIWEVGGVDLGIEVMNFFFDMESWKCFSDI